MLVILEPFAAYLVIATASGAAAQEHRASLEASGHAVIVHRHHDPVPGGRALDELRVVQPLARLYAASGALRLHATLNIEGLTMPNGELTLGAWGEGFVDRRHPHTYLHELMVTAAGHVGGVWGSLSAGKGFVPFGTDDPMTRPPLSYPVNHHLSQILERALVMLALRTGPVTLEGAAFNGDEPDEPGAWPRLGRLGDSWAARITVAPAPAWEGQISHARVASPEHVGGAGLDHAKWSASVRWGECLAEWARTREGDGAFVFQSILLEAGAALGRHHPYARFERTERPEEERLSDFRARRPLHDNAILGRSRWTIWTAGYRRGLKGPGTLDLAPFFEASLGRVTALGGGVFDPEVYYGGRNFAAAAAGLRLSLGAHGPRMGRYH